MHLRRGLAHRLTLLRLRKLVAVGSCLGALSVGFGGCGSDAAPTTTTTALGSLDELTGAGYQLEIINRGATPWEPLLAPAPVGRQVDFDVLRTEEAVSVSGVVATEVVRSAADGSSQEVFLTLGAVAADDVVLARALDDLVGSTLAVDRGVQLAAVASDLQLAARTDERSEQFARQLLESVSAFGGGPLPSGGVGDGAEWLVTWRSADGTTREVRYKLDHFDGTRYLISVEFTDGSAVLEGRVGEAFPDRQEVTIGEIVTIISER